MFDENDWGWDIKTDLSKKKLVGRFNSNDFVCKDIDIIFLQIKNNVEQYKFTINDKEFSIKILIKSYVESNETYNFLDIYFENYDIVEDVWGNNFLANVIGCNQTIIYDVIRKYNAHAFFLTNGFSNKYKELSNWIQLFFANQWFGSIVTNVEINGRGLSTVILDIHNFPRKLSRKFLNRIQKN